ncbi:hypothetical protein ACWC9R_11870 [Streptomyces sp. NPDC001219]
MSTLAAIRAAPPKQLSTSMNNSDTPTSGTVVINSTRQAVWTCYFNDSTWAPEEITLPETLRAVPATGEAEHRDWLHRWEEHITSLL